MAQEAVTGALGRDLDIVTNNRLSAPAVAVDHLAFTVLAPYVGPKAAVEALQAARPPLRAI